ncbi:amidase [Streptomyces smaragdinus]|nr:amidase [Streptomyces smaragdinus]
MAQLHDLTALEQAEEIRTGRVSPVELTEHYLERIDRLNDTLGAFVTLTPEIARKQAADAESEALAARREERWLSPLHGVPVPIKDLTFVAGVRCTLGSVPYGEHVPDTDDHVVTRLRQAGTVMLGKTNTPEFGLPCYTESLLAPPARTPWDLDRSAGGSSGGAAAAVAAGLAPVAQGSDGGGSIRIPAAACGLFGIKPSRGLVGGGPVQHDVSGLSTNGPLARTVADAAALLDIMSGPGTGDPFGAWGLPPGSYLSDYVGADPGRMRILSLTDTPVPGAEVHPDCRAAAEFTTGLLRDLGHEVDEVALPQDGSLLKAFTQVWAVMATVWPVPPEQEEQLMPLTRHLRSLGRKVSGLEFATGLYAFRALGEMLGSSLLTPDTGYDMILTPTLAQPPALVGGLRSDGDPAAEFAAMSRFTPFTAMYNATGQPAVSLPLCWTTEELPIGIMLAGRYGADAELIALSAQLEEACPWADRTPAMW